MDRKMTDNISSLSIRVTEAWHIVLSYEAHGKRRNKYNTSHDPYPNNNNGNAMATVDVSHRTTG